jgi:hypothetical protein
MKLKEKPKWIIGIDPDCDRSGIAVYNTMINELEEVKALSLLDLFEYIKSFKENIGLDTYLIRLEAGWLEKKSNWHGGNNFVAQRIAKNVGSNHEVGRQIEKYLIQQKYNYELLKPLGYSNIFKDAEVFKQVTGWMKQTNEDSRASGAMVWGY